MTKRTSKNSVLRDALYWVIYNNTKAKHQDWGVSQLHAVTAQLRAKAVVGDIVANKA